MSLDEFKIFIEERNLSEEELYTKYWLYALYKISPVDDVTQMNNAAILGETDIISKYINIIWVQIIENIRVMELLFDNFRYYETLAIFLSIPILIVLYKYVFSELKKSKHNKLRVFALFCTLFILPFTFFSSMFFSPDFTRWFGHGFITLFTLVLYDIYKCEKKLSHLLKLSNNNILILSLVLYFMIYMSFTVDAYF